MEELQNRAYIFLKIIKHSAMYPDPVCTKLLRQESSISVMFNIPFYNCIKTQGHNLPALFIVQALETAKLHHGVLTVKNTGSIRTKQNCSAYRKEEHIF